MPDKLKNINTIIFDFDGTVADTLDLGVKISNQLAGKFRYKQIANKEELNFYQNLSTQQALKAIGISLVKLPFVAASFRKELSKEIDQLKPIEGISEVISSLSSNFKLGIVTSNSKHNTIRFLENHNLKQHIQYYSTGIRLFKKFKTINELIIANNIKKENVLLIGDETRDIEAAKKCGLPIVSVGWGFHSKKILSSYNPDYLIESPHELLSLLST